MSVTDLIASVLMVTGSLLSLLGAVGLHRFPDVFARMHAATKPATLGIVLILIGAAFAVADFQVTTTLLLVAALQLITAPVGAHMVGRAAYRAGTELSPMTSVDEMAAYVAADREGPAPSTLPPSEK
ncbi:MAG TPA: monovalent cation/H(+) antiporter subunit G [Acidimicrobiales bacterium]|nr:monovalent cation/H(+) antiporter subunit G [Acidimicrobiales bacterium]